MVDSYNHYPYFILRISFSWVKVSLHIEFQPSRLPRSDRFIQSLTLFKAGVSWVEISFHVEFHPPGLPRSGRFMIGDNITHFNPI